MAKFSTKNPATEMTLGEYEATSAGELREILLKSIRAQRSWGHLTPKERIAYFPKLVSALEELKEKISLTISQEVGKPLRESRVEIERCMMPLRYFHEHGEQLLADEPVSSQAQKSYIRFEPVGRIAIFTPWNYPLWGIFRQLAPALLCGDSLIVKPHLKTTESALAVLEIAKRAGLPENLVEVALGSEEIMESLIGGVEAVTVIASPHLGRRVAEIAGRHLKRINLQLSGSDPFIVLEDYSAKDAARHAVESRLMNAGQDCVSAKRFIVRKEIYREFSKNLVEEMKKVKPGDPFSPKTKIGPLGDEKLLDILENQITDAVQKGAELILGGKRLMGSGYFFPPTVLTGVTTEMRVWQEETFGPVAPIMSVEADEEAVAAANDSPLGLGGSIWTQDLARGESLAQELEAGIVTVNSLPKSSPSMPFGGLKQTGMGRDFSKYGLLHFLNTKSILIYETP